MGMRQDVLSGHPPGPVQARPQLQTEGAVSAPCCQRGNQGQEPKATGVPPHQVGLRQENVPPKGETGLALNPFKKGSAWITGPILECEACFGLILLSRDRAGGHGIPGLDGPLGSLGAALCC